jgi:hypothetical protein
MRMHADLRETPGMAERTVVLLECDLDGEEATTKHEFSYNGSDYHIDLCEKHSAEFESVMDAFAEKARRIGGRRRAPSRTASTNGSSKAHANAQVVDNATIRMWAQKNGYQLGDRGRIPQDIRNAYDARGGK